jgi:hypothetical protein
MDSVNSVNSHDLFLNDCLNFVSLIVLNHLDRQLSLVFRATFKKERFLDGGVTSGLEFLENTGNYIILGFCADGHSLLHDVDSGFGLLAFE